jgi:hypothetical protein
MKDEFAVDEESDALRTITAIHLTVVREHASI